jgi:hypothetical protein
MALSHGPPIVTNGLVLALDAADRNSYDKFENLLQYSEDFSNAYWNKSNVSVTSNAIASPSGSSNASKLVESATTAVHELIRGDGTLGVGSDTYITFSIFAKAAERQYCYIRSAGNSKRIAVVVDLSNGTFNVTNWGFTLNSSATVTPYPNGWYRITATAQSNYPQAPGWNGAFYVSPLDSYQSAGNVGGSGYSYAGNGTSGIYIWGAHYEFGPGISDYYATTGTAKNRGTILTDLIGNGNNGTLTNGPTYSTSNGGSIVFDGTNDYINTVTATSLGINSASTSFSISVWFKTTGSGEYYLFDNYNGSNDISLRIDGGKLEVLLAPTISGIINAVQFGSGYNNGAWHNFTITWNGPSVLVAYADGINIGTNTTTLSGSFETNAAFQIGNRPSAGAGVFPGNIAQVQVYNRALTASEIQQNFNALRGRFNI